MSEKCQSLLRVYGRISAQVATLSYEFEKAHVIAEHYHPEHRTAATGKNSGQAADNHRWCLNSALQGGRLSIHMTLLLT
jgi:hypothetical protein